MHKHRERLAGWLEDMLATAQRACEFADGLSRADFLADVRTQQAVAMSLLIVGEIAAKAMEVEPSIPTDHPQIPWVSMKGMRNRIAHGYFELDLSVVWQTVQDALPELIRQLPALIESVKQQTGRS